MNSHSLTSLNQRLCSGSIPRRRNFGKHSKPYHVGFPPTIAPPPSLDASAGGAAVLPLKTGGLGLNRLRTASNDGQFMVSGSLEESPEPSFVEFITSERVKVVAMLALALALCNADRVVMSVAIVPLSMSRGWGPSFSGVVQSSFLWGYLISPIAGGTLVDRYGGKVVMAWGVALWSLATFLTPWAAESSLLALLVMRMLLGIAEGVALPCMNNMIARWFPQTERSRAVGLAMAGFQLGSAIGLTLSPILMSQAGIYGPFVIFGLFGFLWLLVWVSATSSSPDQSSQISKFELRYIQSRSSVPSLSKSQLETRKGFPPFRRLLSKLPTWSLIVANAMHSWGFFVILSWMPIYFKTIFHVDLRQAAWFSAVPWSMMALTGYLAGVLSDMMIKRGISVTLTRKIMQSIGFFGPGMALVCLTTARSPFVASAWLTAAVGLKAFSHCGFLVNLQEIAPQYSGVLHGAGFYQVGPTNQVLNQSPQASQLQMPPPLQMKKTPSPLIIPPGNIRSLNTKSGNRTRKNEAEKDRSKSNNSALSYIASAAKKVGGVLSVLFFGRKKADSASSRDQVQPDAWNYRAGESPNLQNNSGARDSKRSSRSRRSGYDAYPEVDSAKLRNSLTFEEICKATGNFSSDSTIGEGGFGTVYRAKLKDGSVVAIKRAKSETYDQRLSAEFKNEILALSKIEHQSLVRFFGFIEHGEERLIIVEYVSNGTLREHLDGTRANELEIGERLDIAIDVAHAITYLHTYTDPPIIHRDVKSTNILITEKLRAKVADFGFARLAAEDPGATHISTQIKGTAGYLDPEYLRTYQLTEKSDVYSFGVLLVEIMTGRKPIESKRSLDERVTIRWALRRLRDGEVVVAMDPRLRRSIPSIHAVERVFKLARHCLAPSRLSRPSMRQCAEKLWDIRREFKEKSTTAPPTPYHSAIAGSSTHRNSDSLMFVSA